MAKASKPAELRLKTDDELQTQLLDLKREQFNLRFQRATGQNEGAGRVREVRREIARIKTLVHAKTIVPMKSVTVKKSAGATASASRS